MNSQKPFSQACENNKHAILEKLAGLLASRRRLLEVGSGTGQHAVHFASALPKLQWQCSDRKENLAGINSWIAEAALSNLPAAIALNVCDEQWPTGNYDALYSANTAHIMAWEEVEIFIRRASELLANGGVFCLYGPFNYSGAYTAESNANFDIWLKQRDHQSAIRDFEAVDHCAENNGLLLQQDYAMPANNRLLVWKKSQA
ncbi:MAG: DUF938 domain-containing protein [Spongiibacteraceae bacterium]